LAEKKLNSFIQKNISMHESVQRIMDIDFIYFDLMLLTIWMILLISRKRIKEFFFGLFGFGVVFFTDEVLWLQIQKTRIIEAPTLDQNR
jgi:hypothetical protein